MAVLQLTVVNIITDDQIFIVIDIESDGPTPRLYSMLSLGAVASTENSEVGRFYRTIKPIDGASRHPSNMRWWGTQPEAWKEVNANPRPADEVMKEFSEWVNNFGKQPIFVAYPIAFDYTFVSWYLWNFTGENPFLGEDKYPMTIDIASLVSGKYRRLLNDSTRDSFPAWMKEGMPDHNHRAIDDAIGYAVVLRNIISRDNE